MRPFVSRLSTPGTTIFSEISARALQYSAINLGQGFPDYNPPEELLALVREMSCQSVHQYAPMPGHLGLRRAISEKMHVEYGCDIDPVSEITITAGATQAIFTALLAMVKPGDEVILFEPAYDSYRPSVEIAGGLVVPIPLQLPDFSIPWELVTEAMSDRTRLIIVNTPHNPSGTTWSSEDVATLAALVKGTDINILSDEVYEHLVYDGKRHTCLLTHPVLRERCLSVYSFGKTFHSTGWKTGYCAGPEWMMREFRSIHQWNVFSVNSVFQAALAPYVSQPEHYLSLPRFYQGKRDFFNSQLEGTGLRLLPCEGTFFQVADYSKISSVPDTEFVDLLIREAGVAAIPLSVFSTSSQVNGHIRFCFAKEESTLAEAAGRIRHFCYSF